MRIYLIFPALVVALLIAPRMKSETPPSPSTDLDGAFVQRRFPTEPAKPRIDKLTWTLLAADGGARVLDAYSTRRMLRNNCSSGIRIEGTSTCNYEQNLPGFIANHASGLYTFEGAIWASEFTATRFLVRHHHARLARFIPLVDFLSTTSFAANNLTLSIGQGSALPVSSSNSKHKKHP